MRGRARVIAREGYTKSWYSRKGITMLHDLERTTVCALGFLCISSGAFLLGRCLVVNRVRKRSLYYFFNVRSVEGNIVAITAGVLKFGRTESEYSLLARGES